MTQCDQCGNDYADPMRIEMRGQTYTFDSFECAMMKLAPTCARCGTRVVGHGLQAGAEVYCCGHCADKAGVKASA